MILSLEAVSFFRDGRPVLNGVTAVITDNALTCLVGPNGAGKTTFLRILSGELRATSGLFLIGNADVSALAQRDVVSHFSVIPQGVQPPPHFTVSELVALGRFRPNRALRWRLNSTDREIIHSCLARCQVDELSNRRVEELSGGEQQRAWLAFGLAQERRFLLLDETLDGLDIAAKRSFFQLLKGVASENKGVLLTTHDLDFVTNFADKVIVLSGGRTSYEGPPNGNLRLLLSANDV